MGGEGSGRGLGGEWREVALVDMLSGKESGRSWGMTSYQSGMTRSLLTRAAPTVHFL